MNRDQLIAEIYLRLIDAQPAKTEEWALDEAVRRADRLLDRIEEDRKPKAIRKRKEVVTA